MKQKTSCLYRLRVAIQILVLPLITLLFLDFTNAIHLYFGWLAKVQLLPAILALNVGVVLALAILTFVFGRIYCSVICPLGILQDMIAHLRPKKNRYSYSPERRWLRYGVMVVFIALMVAGFGSIAALLAPYSAFGRIAQSLLQPIYLSANNILASIAEHYNSYAFYEVDVWLRGGLTLAVALATLAVVGFLAWRSGRTYCNTICPVGSLLSLMARHSWLRMTINTDVCGNCGKCERNCKASAIDFRSHTIDASRCVVCGKCQNVCSKDAIEYIHPVKAKTKADSQPQEGRRAFLVGAALATTSAALAQEKKKVDGGLAIIEDKQRPQRNTPILPPGSQSARHFAQHCTACQLCVSACPNGILHPSTDLKTLMQPVMDFDRGYCRPECNRCSQVCPTGAIRPITVAVKSATHIGHAVWVKKNCVVLTDDVHCGNCARHCPTGAIMMVPSDPNNERSPRIPSIDENKCIGCGACEHLCPARPFSAIYVEGHEMQRIN